MYSFEGGRERERERESKEMEKGGKTKRDKNLSRDQHVYTHGYVLSREYLKTNNKKRYKKEAVATRYVRCC